MAVGVAFDIDGRGQRGDVAGGGFDHDAKAVVSPPRPCGPMFRLIDLFKQFCFKV